MEELSARELIEMLDGVRLSKNDRRHFLLAKNEFQAKGRIPTDWVIGLRRTARRNMTRIREVEAARERARVNMALEKRGYTLSEIESLRRQNRDRAVHRVEDLGI